MKKTLSEYHECREEKAFVIQERKLRTLFELVDELETMSVEEFKKFVTTTKNDFASWIRDVFGHKQLAEEAARLQNSTELQRAILKQMARDLKRLVKD